MTDTGRFHVYLQALAAHDWDCGLRVDGETRAISDCSFAGDRYLNGLRMTREGDTMNRDAQTFFLAAEQFGVFRQNRLWRPDRLRSTRDA
jgi:hypothetical protein